MYLLIFFFGLQTFASSLNHLTEVEKKEVETRLENFYSTKDPEAMHVRSPKFDVFASRFVEPHPELKLASSSGALDPLTQLAQIKSTEKFQQHYCKTFLQKHFKDISCTSTPDATIEGRDLVETLAKGWLPSTSHRLNQIPPTGIADHIPWSDDYWRTQWGLTSYRYSRHNPSHPYTNYTQAVTVYTQPSEWLNLLNLPSNEQERTLVDWSPAEKYDLTVGDEEFTLTQRQKNEGSYYLTNGGNVEAWMGICHGWAPAALMSLKPKKATTVVGAKGVKVEWYPADVKAMVSLAWANGAYPVNSVGRRCITPSPQVLPNGRVASSSCFDNNPATFHLALGNLLGRRRVGFIMDKTFDYQVWNQPVYSYEFTYFNPLNRTQKSKNWKSVAVPYDSIFKQSDRFQTPLTRGTGPENAPGQDSKITKIVGVIATVSYLAEITPNHGNREQEDHFLRESYLYDLEIEGEGDGAKVTGGEWLQNSHPDFLWIPGRNSTATQVYDISVTSFSGSETPTSSLTDIARSSSHYSYPLCRVIKHLLAKSSDGDEYNCPDPKN